MSKLDKTKPYGTAFIGDNSYYGQDGKYFDMNTLEEVVPPVHKNKDFACKFCNAIRQTPELLREHLIAAHPELVPDLLPKKPLVVENPEPETEMVPETGPEKGPVTEPVPEPLLEDPVPETEPETETGSVAAEPS